MISHEIMGGKVHVYLRDTNPVWQCSTFFKGRNHRISTKEEGLEQAKRVAEEWYLGLRGKDKAGILLNEKTFKFAADRFTMEYGLITDGQRAKKWVEWPAAGFEDTEISVFIEPEAYHLGFQGFEEGFDHRVVITISFARHRDEDPIALQLGLIVD